MQHFIRRKSAAQRTAYLWRLVNFSDVSRRILNLRLYKVVFAHQTCCKTTTKKTKKQKKQKKQKKNNNKKKKTNKQLRAIQSKELLGVFSTIANNRENLKETNEFSSTLVASGPRWSYSAPLSPPPPPPRWFILPNVLRRWSRWQSYSLLLCGLFYEAICFMSCLLLFCSCVFQPF